MVYSYLRTIYSELPNRSKKKNQIQEKKQLSNFKDKKIFKSELKILKNSYSQSEKEKNSIKIKNSNFDKISKDYKLLEVIVMVERLDKKFLNLIKKKH